MNSQAATENRTSWTQRCAIVVRHQLRIDPQRFKVDRGAIAHGHPIGANGPIPMRT